MEQSRPNPRRGDIFYVSKDSIYANVGTEINPNRPAVIVSNDANNRFANQVEVVYLTTQEKPPLETHVPVMCKLPSTALCEQITTVSKERLQSYVMSCTQEEMQAINRAMLASLGIKEEPANAAKSVPDAEAIRLAAERDIYKALYEQMLEKITT